MGKARLLIVEDDIDISNMLKIYFSSQGFDVDAALRGREALEKTRQVMPHLIILDIMLPDIDGYEVCRDLRTHTRTSHVPVIFLTQKDERSDKLQGLELGADDYITKPFDIEELKWRVQNAINRSERESLTDPQTGLPAGRLIEDHLRRIIRQTGWAMLDIRINQYETFKDVYGFIAANDVLRFTAMMVGEVADELGTVNDFIGQAGGDNFVVVTSQGTAPEIRRRLKDRFKAEIQTHYNFMDRQQGFIVAANSEGKNEQVSLMTLAVGIVSPADHMFADIREITELAAEARAGWIPAVRDSEVNLRMMPFDNSSLGIALIITGLVLVGVICLLLGAVQRNRKLVETALPDSPALDLAADEVSEYPPGYEVSEYPPGYEVSEYPPGYEVSEYPRRYGTPDGVQEYHDAILVLKPGGRVSWMNSRARQVFGLSEQEIPNLERLVRHTRPGAIFLSLCAAEGQASFAIDGHLVQGTSYQVQSGGLAAIIFSVRYPELSAEGLSQAVVISGETMRTITDLYRDMAASLDLKISMQAIALSTEKLIKSDAVEVNIWDSADQYLTSYRLMGEQGEDRHLEISSHRYSSGEGLSGVLVITKKPLLVADILLRPDLHLASGQPLAGLRSYLGVPLMVADELVGTIELGSLSVEAFLQADLDLLMLLAPQAANAVHNAQLFKEEQRRTAELAGLAQLSQALGLFYDSRDLYGHLIQCIAPLINVQVLGFLIYSENKRLLQGQLPFLGLPPQFVQSYSQMIITANSPAEEFLVRQEMLVSLNAAEDPYWTSLGFDRLSQPASLHEAVLVPIKSAGRTLGFLLAANHSQVSVPEDSEHPYRFGTPVRLDDTRTGDGAPGGFEQAELHLLQIIANQTGPIIENANLVQQSRQRAQRAEALRQIASLASSAATLDEILRFSLQELVKLVKADIGLIFLMDNTGSELRMHITSAIGFPPEATRRVVHLSVDDPQFHFTVTGRNHTIISGHMAEEKTIPPVYKGLVNVLGIEAAMIIPLVVRDQGVGELWLGSHETDFFDSSDLLTVATAGGQLAGVVEQSYLTTQTDESLRRRLEQLTALTRISRELSTTLDVKYLLQMVYDETLRTSRADSGTILLFDLENTDLTNPRIQYFVGDPPTKELSALECAMVAQSETIKVADYAHSEYQPSLPEVQSALVVPIVYQQQVAGFIHLRALTPGRFDEASEEITQALAVQVSLVLGNVLQYQDVLRRGELLKRQVETMAGLFETSQVLRTGLPLAQSLQAIGSAIQQVTTFQLVLISVYQPETGQLQRVCGIGFSDETWRELQAHIQPWHSVENLLRPEFRIGRSFYIPSNQQPALPADMHTVTVMPSLVEKREDTWDPDDLLLVPLLSPNGVPLGLVSVDNPRDGHRPDRSTIEALDIFAGQAALAIEVHRRLDEVNEKITSLQTALEYSEKNAQDTQVSLSVLLQKDLEQVIAARSLEQQGRRIRDCMEIAVLVNQQADIPTALSTFGQELVSRLELDLVLAAESTPGGVHLVNVSGPIPPGANPEALFGQRNPLRQLFKDGELVLIDNIDKDPELQSAPLLHVLEARSLVCLPVKLAGEVVAGVLAIGHKVLPPFTEEDKEIFLLLTSQVAIAYQNLALLMVTGRRLQEVDLLLAFSRQLGSLNPTSIMNTLVESILKTLPEANAGMVAVWDSQARQLVPRAASGYSDNNSLMEIIYTDEGGVRPLPLQVFLSGQPARIDEVNFAHDYNLSADNLLRYRRATGGRLPVSSLFIPIKTGEVVLGLIALDNFIVPSAFTAGDETLAVSLAQQTALALENARLFLASQQRAMQLQALMNVAGMMSSSLQTDRLVTSLLDHLQLIIPYDTATLWLRNGDVLTVAVASGFLDSEQRHGISVALEDSIMLKEMITTGQPIFVKDVRGDARFSALVDLDYRSWLGLPLIAKGEVIGVIALEKVEVDFYTPEHIQAAATFAGQSAIALENARLYEESLRRAAELDQRSQRLALLNRLSSELASSLDVDTILNMAAQELLTALKATVVSAVQIDQNGQATLRIEAPVIQTDLPQKLPDAPLFERLRESMGIFSTNDITLEPELALLEGFLSQRNTCSLLAVPLSSAGKLQGILLLQTNYSYRFSSPEIELALTIANQTAIAAQNARLFAETVSLTEDLEQRVSQRTVELIREHRNTQALLAVITELSASLDIFQVLNRTLSVLAEAVDAEQSVIFLSRNGLMEVAFRSGSERPSPGSSWSVFTPEPEIARIVFERRQPVTVEDITHDHHWQGSPNPAYTFRCILAVPLVLGEEILGALLLLRGQPSSFDSGQISLVEGAARQISVSLNNAELFNLIRDQAENMGGLLREQQIEASRSRAILEAVADGVLVTDASSRITLLNASAERILDLRSSQMTGHLLEQFPGLFGKSTRRWLDAMRAWSTDPGSYQPGDAYSAQVGLDDGRMVEVDLAPVFLRSQFLGTVSIFHDITNEVRVDRLKSEFVANVSHELRTPMTSIKGYVDVMLMGAAGELNAQQTHFLEVVKSNTQRLNVLVNDLLDVSRIEAGRVTLNIGPLNLAEIAQDVIDDFRQHSQEDGKAMDLRLDVSPGLPWIEGDAERVRQILVNLVSNAYNYTPADGKVTVSTHLLPGELQVDIIDNGIGIQPVDQPRIFERFYRGEDPLVLATSGTGLGLAIVKALVEMHHGRIWFASTGESGQGSIFSFVLPLHQAGE